MSDFQITVGGDFGEILRGFQQLEAKAAQSGATAGRGLAEGIQGFSSRSIAALQTELNRLQQRQTRVAIDSTAFEKAGARIREIEGLLSQVQRKRVTLGVDDRSILALRSRLGELQGELERVQIGSQRFKELTAAIQATERELAKAGESADGFRLLDGVVQGIAFSLSNAVVNGAQQALAALGGVVAEFGRLDTELRQAAAASGEKGAYESLARNVEQVGIEAAGTTMEVAQLNTELIRGGMTVDQANASLKAIVRGAEATGTGFANMGSVVSASLKGFGLQASDASRVVDALVTGANASAASVDGMGMAFKYAAPVAKILGVSVEDLGVAIGLLTNAGIDASEAGVTLRNGLSKLASAAPSTNGAVKELSGQAAAAATAVRNLSVDIYNADGTLRPMEETLLKLKGAFEKLDPATKIRLAANLFGGEDDGAKWLALLNQSEVEIKKMSSAMANTKGATDTARDAMQGFEMKLKALDGSLGAIGNTFGSVAAAALIPFIDAANLIVGAIVALPGPIKALAAGVSLLTGAYVAATVAQIAFTKAIATAQVQDAIGGLKALGSELVGRFKQNLDTARTSWLALQAAFTTTNSNAIIAALAQIGQGLRNLSVAQTVEGFRQMGLALQTLSAQAKLASAELLALGLLKTRQAAADASVALFDLGLNLRQSQKNSAAAQSGLSGVQLALQQLITNGLGKGSNASLQFSNVLNKVSKVSGPALVTSLQSVIGRLVGYGAALLPATAATLSLAAAAAAVVPAVVGYNKIMGEVRQETEAGWQSVERFGQLLKKNGTEFEDFGKKGGPVGEAFTFVKRAIQNFLTQIEEIPIVGEPAKKVLEGLAEAVKLITGVKLIEWGRGAVDIIKAMYAEAAKNQKIIEFSDQVEQFGEQFDASAAKATKLIERLQAFDQIPPGAIDSYTVALNKNREEMAAAVATATNLEADYNRLAEAAKQNNQPDLVTFFGNLALAQQSNAKIAATRLSQLDAEAQRTGLVVNKLKEQELGLAAVSQKIQQLNSASAQTGAQLQIGQALLNYATTLSDLEQSRFSIVKARGDYELQQAEQKLTKDLEAAKLKGASDEQLDVMRRKRETELEMIRVANRQAETLALQARFTALQQEQQLQQVLLTLSQEKARQEANLEVLKARSELLLAEKAINDENNKVFKDPKAIEAAKAKYEYAKAGLDVAKLNQDTLKSTQSLDQLIVDLKNEAAQNALKAQAAQDGVTLATSKTVPYAEKIREAAKKAGFEFQAASDGTTRLAQTTEQASKKASDTAAAAINIAKGFDQSSDSLNTVKRSVDGTTASVNKAADATSDIGGNAASSNRNFGGLQKTVADTAKAAAYGAQMANVFNRASSSIGAIAVAMASAARSALAFYNTLAKASGLPNGRWTGGPVDAGTTYRINELGQEAFLRSSGRVSLINKPANSLWTAPSSGVVIPAGITEQLKSRGVFKSGTAVRANSGGSVLDTRDMASNLARQAVAIGKLQESVDQLVAKDWNVQVRVRNTASGATYLDTLSRMR